MEDKKDIRAYEIDELELKVRPYNTLEKAHRLTVDDLFNMTPEELSHVRLGRKQLEELIARLAEMGIYLDDKNGEE